MNLMMPRSMSKFAIITEIECDILGKINAFQGFLLCEWCSLTSWHSDNALETIEWSMLTQVLCPYLPPFRRYGSQKKVLGRTRWLRWLWLLWRTRW